MDPSSHGGTSSLVGSTPSFDAEALALEMYGVLTAVVWALRFRVEGVGFMV